MSLDPPVARPLDETVADAEVYLRSFHFKEDIPDPCERFVGNFQMGLERSICSRCEWEFEAHLVRDLLAEIRQLRAQLAARQPLFQQGPVQLHSGAVSTWKIDCDALTEADLATLAKMLVEILPPFGSVEGVPRGGVRLAQTLGQFTSVSSSSRLLIVDDVCTTGASLEQQRQGRDAIGAVLFARGACPSWVTPLFTHQAVVRAQLAAQDSMSGGVRLSDEPCWTFTEYRGAGKAVVALDAAQAARVKHLLLHPERAAQAHYVSTACHHARHGDCRKVCKFCAEPCRCLCHHSVPPAPPEPPQ